MIPKVSFENVSKKYFLTKTKAEKIKSLILPGYEKNGFYAVRNISFEVNSGETIGFVGINGSGKSTMSNLLARIIPPTEGKIFMNGQPSLIAIAAGLNNALTGKDNIHLKCLMMGLTNKEIAEIYDSIVEFADIGDFIDQPVKSYSSGMKSRLGFAISVHIEPDILIIDEALSVGDQTFYQKCVDKITDFKKQGKTIFFVSHSISQIEMICDRVAWMHYGEMKMFDETDKVIKEYKSYISWYNKLSKQEKEKYQSEHKESRKRPLEIDPTQRISRIHREKKPKKVHSLVPILVLLFLLVGTATTMFIDKPLRTIVTFGAIGSTSTAKPVPTEKESTIKTINKPGLIIANTASLYEDKYFRQEKSPMPFGTAINIETIEGDTAKVTTDNLNGYMKKSDILLTKKDLEQSSINIQDLSSQFSERAAESYQFLLALLGENKEDMAQKLTGAVEENKDAESRLYLPHENVYYVLNKDNKATKIVFNDFNIIQSSDLDLSSEQVIHSKDDSCYLFKNDQATYIIDNNNNQLRYSINDAD